MLRANGISLTNLSKELVFCKLCQVVKSHKLPFYTKHDKHTITFVLIYLDLWTSKLSYIDDKYFLSMVDDYSRYIWFFSLKTKDQNYYIHIF